MPEQYRVPEKPTLEGLEEKWQERWRAEDTYRFPGAATRDEVFSIDTPPPTVSGSLHVGHIFSYTHTDLIARYRRMTGKKVFYPIGWDDNGLPTERRVQNFYGVRCDPKAPYDPDFTPPEKPDPKRQVSISRPNFIELCAELTHVDEKAFEDMWRRVGLSVDWSLLYTTISPDSRRVSQLAFLRNLARDEAYLSEAPSMWDVTFQTAVAQAELEARAYPGAFHKISFRQPDGGDVFIETTRPELIPACVALLVHPDDERFSHLAGTTVTSPLFDVELPVHAHEAVEMDKGSGVVMCCTFGDLTDVIWWRELALPTRTIIGRDGRLLAETPEWLTGPGAEAYAPLGGKTVFSARELIVAALKDAGRMEGEPRKTERMANFYEKGDKPLEIVSSRQWYIRNGGRDEALKEKYVELGAQMAWHPAHMRHRYTNWVEGLAGDWLISRQRFFGVPFPVWYALDAQGEPDYARILVPDETRLPLDPTTETPEGYDEAQRDVPGGFTADPDIMDTWATSSLTPQIACGWERDEQRFATTYPMDLNTHAHEIIRTWLFSRVVRSELENHELPWGTNMISGFVVDPDRKKLSKSKGNAIIPDEILKSFGSDAVRWRAAMARPGMDSPFDETQMKVGRRLAIKVLNASKFVLSMGGSSLGAPVTEPLDLAMLRELDDTVAAATAAFEAYDYTTALERAEKFFWTFCDDYVELVKERVYGEDGTAADSARSALLQALSVQIRLFAPFLPFVTEEVWSWWQEGSVHLAPWPALDARVVSAEVDPGVYAAAGRVLAGLRTLKSQASVSMKTDLTEVVVTGDATTIERARQAEHDLGTCGHVPDGFTWVAGSGELTVTGLPAVTTV